MIVIIQDWLFSKVGINCDLNNLDDNNIFQDGYVIASILQKYGLLNESFVECFQLPYKQEQCEHNLTLLKPLFEMLKVNYDSNVVRGIMANKASTIITLLYELFVCLENKQHLYFVTKQNLSKVQTNLIENLTLESVGVKIVKPDILGNGNIFCFEEPIVRNKDIIKWYKNKCELITRTLNERLRIMENSVCTQNNVQLEAKKKKCCFSHSESVYSPIQLPEEDAFLKDDSPGDILDYKDFLHNFKSKQYHSTLKQSLEKNIQHDLITQTWSKVMEKQNEIYNSVFTDILLKQSQYEKQMLTKLIQTQNQINIENEHKLQASIKVTNEQEQEINYDHQLKEDFENLEDAFKNEQNRVLELHRKLYKEKQDVIKRKRTAECVSVVDALIDLSIHSSEYQLEYDIPVPNNLWSTWMQFFFKSRPIHIPFQKLRNDILMGLDINYDEVITFESQQSKIVSENDLNEYLYTCGRWFYKDVCLEHEYINESILAFIVYRLLSMKYPPPPSPLPADIPFFHTSAILLNLHGPDCIENLRVLLTKPGVHVFDTDTVIKKCITAFKNETQSHVEEGSKNKRKQSKSKNAARKDSKKKTKKDKSKHSSTGKIKNKKPKTSIEVDSPTAIEGKIIDVVDKETQTSIIREEFIQPRRTPLGLIGETISAFLKSGEQLDDSTLVSAIIEYLKSLEGVNGWVLLNFPLTLNQAAALELALTGKYIPTGDYGIEDIELQKTSVLDEFSEKRKSQLLPCPISSSDVDFKTHFSIFIKTKNEATDHNNETQNDDDTESLAHEESQKNIKSTGSVIGKDIFKNVDVLEQFYKDQTIFKEFMFRDFDIVTLKKLARTVLKEDGISAKVSIDLFGDDSLNKLVKGKKGKNRKSSAENKGRAAGKRMKSKSKSPVHSVLYDKDHVNTEGDNKNNELEIDAMPNVIPLDTLSVHLDDEYWHTISLPIDNEIACMLATIWENIENTYVNNLVDIFVQNRIVQLGLVPYTTYVKEEVNKVINKEDLKQNLLDIFLNKYNSIQNNLRVLSEVKSQLHCKVLEMQHNLWSISDERRQASEGKRQHIIHENWVVNEICMIINNFISLIQIEFERSLETMKLINDYYFIMLDKTPHSSLDIPVHNIARLTVDNLLLGSENSSITRLSSDSLASNPRENYFAQILIKCERDDTFLDFLSSFLYKEIDATSKVLHNKAQLFYSKIKTETDNLKSMNKKQGKSKGSIVTNKSKKGAGKNSIKSISLMKPQNIESMEQDHSNNTTDIVLRAWSAALDIEVKRFNFRMHLIKKRSEEDLMEYFCYIENIFCELHSLITLRYDKEISNINKLCELLKTAIEEETPITQPLVIDKDVFFVNNSDCYKDKHSDERIHELIEEVHDCIFTVSQLNKLKNIFKIAGPYGVIRKQPFCYILQDLMLFSAADNEPHLPRLWTSLNEPQLRDVIDTLFGPEYAVDWRDFIIYNLNIPYPNVDHILSLRERYLQNDHEHTELVSLEHYEHTILWFEEDLADSPQDALRIGLIKRLLFEMFQVDENNVNYTALLLYFCKDLDPILGFRKALVLSIGKNVITSKQELNDILREEAELRESVTNLLNELVNSVVYNREGVLIYEIFPSDSETNLTFGSVMEPNYSINSSGLMSNTTSVEIASDTDSLIYYKDTDKSIVYKEGSICEQIEKRWVSRIPVDTVVSVLNACFHHQDKTYSLRNTYLNCLEEEADMDGMIEAYALVTLSCIVKLFTMTHKFKISETCSLLREHTILKK